MPKRSKAGLGLLSGYARIEARDQREPDRLMIGEVVALSGPGHRDFTHADGEKDSRLVAIDGAVEALRRNSENGESMAIDENCLTCYIGRRAEAGLPVIMAQDNYRIGVLGGVVECRKEPSHGGSE